MSTLRAAHEPSSSSTFRCAYQVFLSFRGEDTRKTFTDHLYTALVNAGFHTFRDDDELERGEDIQSELAKAIQQSQISVIVFSKDYASSRWCLDELVNILARKKSVGHMVLPVFYHIDPSDVRKQTGSFEESFATHEKRFKEEMDKVEGWRSALREAADFVGMPLQNQANGHEAQFIQNIIKEIGTKLHRTVLNVAFHPIGTDSRVKDINLWLEDKSSTDVGIAIICGMGGIGKTNSAKIAYNLNFHKFEGSSFLANIRDASEQPNGLVRLQKQLVSDILKGIKIKIHNIDEGIIKIRDAVCSKRVLVVLDDIDHLDQLNAILGMRNWFRPGSKIIITTRHEHLLKAHEACKIFKVKELDSGESLKLFSWHAFGQNHPPKGYIKLSKSIVGHCGGLPLALQVLGSSLSGKNLQVWKSKLQKLQEILDVDILKILKTSYDSLQDDNDKNLFLDIACFFVGKKRDYAITILDGCDFYTADGIQNLIDRCLIAIDEKNKLGMHQLLQDMGREIVRRESSMEPGGRSRLWNYKDSFSVLRKKTGTEAIKGLILNFETLNENTHEKTISSVNKAMQRCFEQDAFARMHKVKILSLNDVQLSGSYEKFPKDIRLLCWQKFSLESIPTNFSLENLVALDMRNSRLKHLWEGTKFLVKLKILNLSYSRELIDTPDFSGLPSLETLKLKDCTSLIEVHESVGDLDCLVLFTLEGCKNLRKLPQNIGKLKSLRELYLSGCSKLELQKECGQLESLRTFHANGTAINSLRNDSRIGSAFSLACLPHSLVRLSLVDCNLPDNAIPSDLSILPSLRYLDLSENPMSSLPESSISRLSNLYSLNLYNCTNLLSFPELPKNLELLSAFGCTSLESVATIPMLNKLTWYIGGCYKLLVDLGMYNHSSLLSSTKIKFQGSYKFRNLTFIIPRREVPDWYTYKSTGYKISLQAPLLPNHKILGLDICFVIPLVKISDHSWHSVRIRNVTKGCELWNHPFPWPTPDTNEDLMWLYRWWPYVLIEAGDKVIVSMESNDKIVVGNKFVFGVNFAYDDQEVKSNDKIVRGNKFVFGVNHAYDDQEGKIAQYNEEEEEDDDEEKEDDDEDEEEEDDDDDDDEDGDEDEEEEEETVHQRKPLSDFEREIFIGNLYFNRF